MKRSAAILAFAVLLTGCERPPVSSPPAFLSATDPDRLVNQAIAALQQKHYHEAVALFESALHLRPDATVFALLGDCYWSQWKHGNLDPRLLERANLEYLKGHALDPNHCGLNHALGRDLVLLGQPAAALPYLDAAAFRCAGQPLEAQNLRFRIQALVQLKQIEEAKTDFADLQARFAANPMTARTAALIGAQTGDRLPAEPNGPPPKSPPP